MGTALALVGGTVALVALTRLVAAHIHRTPKPTALMSDRRDLQRAIESREPRAGMLLCSLDLGGVIADDIGNDDRLKCSASGRC